MKITSLVVIGFFAVAVGAVLVSFLWEPDLNREREKKAANDIEPDHESEHTENQRGFGSTIIRAVNKISNEIQRTVDEETPRNKSENRLKKLEIAGLFLAAGVGLVAILASALDSAEQRDVMQGQLNAMEQEGRAWVGPSKVYLEDPNSNEEPLKVITEYRNFGRTPATHVQHHGGAILPPITVKNAIKQLHFWNDKAKFNPSSLCGIDTNSVSDFTAYPSNFDYTTDVGVEKNTVLTNKINNAPIPIEDIISQIRTNQILYVVFGCFTYTTFEATISKTWCAFLNPDAGESPLSKRHFVFCPYEFLRKHF